MRTHPWFPIGGTNIYLAFDSSVVFLISPTISAHQYFVVSHESTRGDATGVWCLCVLIEYLQISFGNGLLLHSELEVLHLPVRTGNHGEVTEQLPTSCLTPGLFIVMTLSMQPSYGIL